VKKIREYKIKGNITLLDMSQWLKSEILDVDQKAENLTIRFEKADHITSLNILIAYKNGKTERTREKILEHL
jgi:hypothetical protein